MGSNASDYNGLSHAFRRLLQEHAAGFALAKRLSRRPEGLEEGEYEPISARSAQVLREMSALYAALREVVQTQANDGADPSDLAEAMAALDAINPGSPEWGPGFLVVSELVEAESVRTWKQTAETG